MPTFSDLELENREIPSLARTWQGWREAANRALSVSGEFFNNESETVNLDCFTILKRTYDAISLIIPCNEIHLYLEEELNFLSEFWWPRGHSIAPTQEHIFAYTVVSFGKVRSSLKPFWGLFEREDDVCFYVGKGDGLNSKMLLMPRQIPKYAKTESSYKLTCNRNIPNRIYRYLLLTQRMAHQDLEALNRIARNQNIPPRFSLGARHLLDVAVREFRVFDQEAGQVVHPVGYSGASGVIPTMPRGYTGYSGISGYSGRSGISGYSGVSGYSGYSPSGRQGRVYPPLSTIADAYGGETRLESGIIPRPLAEGKAGEDIPEEEKRKDQDKWDLL
jgi:hypothetical protein